MKALLFVLSAIVCVLAAALSTMRVDPVYACPASNNIFFTAPSLDTPNGSGHFEYDITVDGWELTFSPVGLAMNLDTTYTFGVDEENLEITPNAFLLKHRTLWLDHQSAIKGPTPRSGQLYTCNAKSIYM